MPIDTARRRAGKHATKHRARFGMPAQRFHCTQDYLDGDVARLKADIELVEALQDKSHTSWDTFQEVIAALRAQQETR